jgi:hypothetical protein
MDLTVPVSIIAILVAVGTFLLVVRELFQFLWLAMPSWLRFVLMCGLALGTIIFLSNR